jgi:hypothetical protein
LCSIERTGGEVDHCGLALPGWPRPPASDGGVERLASVGEGGLGAVVDQPAAQRAQSLDLVLARAPVLEGLLALFRPLQLPTVRFL